MGEKLNSKKLRLCLNCGELLERKSIRKELCDACVEELSTIDVPEPVDFGEQICWFDNKEVKIHHCMSRKETASNHVNNGRRTLMPQCAKCGSSKETTPKPAVFEMEDTEIALCVDCKRKYKRGIHQRQQIYCRSCANKRQKGNRKCKTKKGVVK